MVIRFIFILFFTFSFCIVFSQEETTKEQILQKNYKKLKCSCTDTGLIKKEVTAHAIKTFNKLCKTKTNLKYKSRLWDLTDTGDSIIVYNLSYYENNDSTKKYHFIETKINLRHEGILMFDIIFESIDAKNQFKIEGDIDLKSCRYFIEQEIKCDCKSMFK